MKKKWFGKKLSSLLLVLSMVITLIPSVLVRTVEAATGETTYVLAGGDYQTKGDHANSAANTSNILKQIKEPYPSIDGFIFTGDYDNETHAWDNNNGEETRKGIASLMETVQGYYSNINHDNTILVEGNHDSMVDGIDKTGAHEFEKYSVFVLNEDDFSESNAQESQYKGIATQLKTYFDKKIEDKYSKPIFVTAHVSLAFSPRTVKYGDGKYAKIVFDVLNEAAASGLNIFFLHGHNHSRGYDNYLGGEAIYLAKGDKINIAEKGSQSKFTVETLNFTYMNSGYVGYFDDYANSTTNPEKLTMTMFEITDNEVTIKRYSKDGIYNLKSAGRLTGTYGDDAPGVVANTTVYESPQTVKLNKFATPVTLTHEQTSVSVTTFNITDLNVTQRESTVEGYETYITYDITPANYVDGDFASVTIEVDTTKFDVNRPVLVIDNKLNTTTKTNIVDGKVTFNTNHFSEYIVAQLSASEIEWTEIPSVTAIPIFELTDTLTANKKYLIVSTNKAGEATITNNNSNAINAYSVTVKQDAKTGKIYIESAPTTAQWTYVNSRFQSVSNTERYLRANSNTLSTTTSGSNQNNGTYSSWVYSNGLRAREKNNTKYRYMTSVTTSSSTASNRNRVYIYVESTLEVTGSSIYAGMSGTTYYSVPVNSYTTENLLNTIKNQITVYSADDDFGTNKDEVKTSDFEITGDLDATTEGNYTLKVEYKGISLGEIKVEVFDKEIESISLDKNIGEVERGSKTSTETGSVLTVTYVGGLTETVPVRLEMLEGTYNIKENGTYTNLTINYGGQIFTDYTLKVVNVKGNDYPEYPNEGSVKVDKTADSTYLQSTGVSKVELSTSGIPVKKGADVIVMLDMSSSMTKTKTEVPALEELIGNNTRLTILEESLVKLVETFNKPAEDGEPQDIRVAMATFNGLYGWNRTQKNTPYDTEENDRLSTSNAYPNNYANSTADVLTGDDLTADSFVNVRELPKTFDLDKYVASGTNYDYAFDAIYQLGESIKLKNEKNNEDRDLYVIFMSDGAAMQYNYYHSIGGNNSDENWNKWLTGEYKTIEEVQKASLAGAHAYYYNMQDTDGDGKLNEHRIANAIKGDPNQRFEIIRKNTNGISSDNIKKVEGTNSDYLYTVDGLGAKMFSIAFAITADGDVNVPSITASIERLATIPTAEDKTQYFYNITSANQLSEAFNAIGNDIKYAATDAYFIDQMGDSFNIQLTSTVNKRQENGNVVPTALANLPGSIKPMIQVLTYNIYSKLDIDKVINGVTVTADMVGKRYGSAKVDEEVTFTDDGNGNLTGAYSNLIYTTDANDNKTYTNILKDGVIQAKYFWYNTTNTTKTITLVNGKTYDLPKESFYWNIGIINNKEYALSYYVYLEGSMEGNANAGSYKTNNYATLYYKNWLGNDAYKDTTSPTVGWESANVSYGFYLVNKEGKPVVNQTTGETGSFYNAVKVTQPVLWQEILLNNLDTINKIEASSLEVLPDGYELYDNTTTYKIVILSEDGKGSWTINYDDTKVQTTYVTGFDATHASNVAKVTSNQTVSGNDYTLEKNYDYTHTTVWFAVVWDVQALPDSIVVDYGLPVDISVLTNDMFGEYGKLEAVGPKEQANLEGFDTTLAAGFKADYDGNFGSAVINKDTNKVRYSLNGTNINDYEEFAYAVNYTGKANNGYYYNTVTVIPASTIYYEDSFIEFEGKTKDDQGNYQANNELWKKEGTTVENATQAEDRPGYFSLTDANNIYGYDQTYAGANMSQHSLGSAMKAHITSGSIGTAAFDFWGTGFDVIGLTSNKTGTLIVQVYNYDDDRLIKSYVVDTYYGYKYDILIDEEGNQVVDEEGNVKYGYIPTTSDDENAIYQVPVMKIENINNNSYGHYKVKISASYSASFDHTVEEGYDLYIDAVRIYDPSGVASGNTSNDIIENAYKADNEGWPLYLELRNEIIKADSFNNGGGEKVNGIVFVDGIGNTASISDYTNVGPNNEVYLKDGQAIAFKLDLSTFVDADGKSIIADVQLGAKSANGKEVSFEVYNITAKQEDAGHVYKTLTTSTDMHYSINALKKGTIVIKNNDTEGTVLSLTDIKITFKQNPYGTDTSDLFVVDDEVVTYSLRSLNRVVSTTFTPEVFNVDVTETVELGNKVLVNVTTSSEVAYVNVNGEILSEYVEENNLRTFTIALDTTNVGTKEVIVKAYNEERVEAETQCYAEVEVTEKTFAPKTFEVDAPYAELINKKFKVTVKTSTDVGYITVNGETFTSFKTNKAKGTRTWTINLTAKEVGKFNVDVVAYDKDNTSSETITEVVEITSVKKIIKDIIDWIFG